MIDKKAKVVKSELKTTCNTPIYSKNGIYFQHLNKKEYSIIHFSQPNLKRKTQLIQIL